MLLFYTIPEPHPDLLPLYKELAASREVSVNQSDYDETEFSVIAVEPLILHNRNGSVYRRMLYLLKPKVEKAS